MTWPFFSRTDGMSGVDFEGHVAMVLMSHGYQVETTATVGDYGVDLVATMGWERVAVQCKRHARPVGVEAVQQVVAGAAVYDCDRSMVVTNHVFTPAAKKLAARNSCTLIDGVRLRELEPELEPDLEPWSSEAEQRAAELARCDGGLSLERLADECSSWNRWPAAERVAERAASEYGRFSAFLVVADRLLRVSRFDDAERLVARAAEHLKPAQVARVLALIRAAQGRWYEAEDLAGLVVDGDVTALHLELALKCVEAGEWPVAERLAANAPAPGEVWGELMLCRAAEGALEEAERLAALAALSVDGDAVAEKLALMYAEMDLWERAEQLAQQAPGDPDAITRKLALMCVEMNLWERAEQLARKARQPKPILLEMAIIFRNKGYWRDAERIEELAARIR